MNFYIEKEIFEKFPDLKVGVLLMKGVNNHNDHKEIISLLRNLENKLKSTWEGKELKKEKKIADWREAYRLFGYKPSSCLVSVEALLRHVLRGKGCPDINPIVNLYNFISLKYLMPVGGDDLSHVEGAVRLSFAKGDESYTMLGSNQPQNVKPGEVIYRDDVEVLCKGWNYRECEKSKISSQTQQVLLVVEGLKHTAYREIKEALTELKELILKYCQGTAELYLLDQEIPSLCEKAQLQKRSHLFEISKPIYHTHEAFLIRSQKLSEIRSLGIDPYPHKYEPTSSIGMLRHKFEHEEIGTAEEAMKGQTKAACIAGRLLLFRAMGKNAFAQIQDESGRLQLMCNRDHTKVKDLNTQEGLSPLKFIEKKIDIGDILGIKGYLFHTQKKELTLFVQELTLLSKGLLPLPDKHHGLSDRGTRYRKRWLDLITHQEVMDRLKMRSSILSHIRQFCVDEGFIEVETPVLQNIYGGAEARPFITKLHALHQTMYMRIALEISLKKLIIGGMSRIFEIGKVYRNEGLDRTHNPEFTMLEAYAAYWDYHDAMCFTENLFAYLALKLFDSTRIGKRKDKKGNEHDIDLKTPWKRLSMKEAIRTYGKCDPDALTEEEMRLKLKDHVEDQLLKKASRGKLIAYLFEEFAEEHLIKPHHIIDHPIETTPLCKLHRDPKLKEERFVERFETFILGYEFCNAYTELNDPQLQRILLEEQNKKREGGDLEANPMDEEFLEAICLGMPPTGGLGIGIDRLAMLLTDAYSIRDVLYFPMMRPEE